MLFIVFILISKEFSEYVFYLTVMFLFVANMVRSTQFKTVYVEDFTSVADILIYLKQINS